MISLKQLRYLSALARQCHFGRAAEECHVSQPALSLQIQELEAELGCQLVERQRGAVALTEMGAEIAERAQRILLEANDLVDHARRQRGLLEGPLGLGVIPSIAPYLLPAALPLMPQRHPGLQLRLRETQTATLLEELAEGRLDVALLSLPIERAGIATLPLFDDPFLLAAPRRPQPHLEPFDPGRGLAGEGLLLLEEGHCLRDQALSVCGTVPGGSRRQYGASSLSTIMQMVANGFGSTLLPAMALAVELRPDMPVRLFRFAPPAPSRSIGLAWRRSSGRKADFEALGAILKDIGEPGDARMAATEPQIVSLPG